MGGAGSAAIADGDVAGTYGAAEGAKRDPVAARVGRGLLEWDLLDLHVALVEHQVPVFRHRDGLSSGEEAQTSTRLDPRVMATYRLRALRRSALRMAQEFESFRRPIAAERTLTQVTEENPIAMS
jgi:hypothetical protein